MTPETTLASEMIPVPGFTAGGNLPIKRVVIHCTQGGGTARNVAAYWGAMPSTRRASGHYVVDDLDVIQCVWEKDIAWHAPPNTGSIGIEILGYAEWTREQWLAHEPRLRRAAELTADVLDRREVPCLGPLSPPQLLAGMTGVTGHVEVSQAWGKSSHWDPGPGFPWIEFMSWTREAYSPPPPSEVPTKKKGRMYVYIQLEGGGSVFLTDFVTVFRKVTDTGFVSSGAGALARVAGTVLNDPKKPIPVTAAQLDAIKRVVGV